MPQHMLSAIGAPLECLEAVEDSADKVPCAHGCLGRMRLVLLFALRYEREGQAAISDLLSALQDYGLSRPQLGLVRTLLAHAGADKRRGDLFSNRSFSSRFATMAKQSLRVRAGRACFRCGILPLLLCNNSCCFCLDRGCPWSKNMSTTAV